MSKSGVVFLTHSVVVFGDKELPVRFIHRVTDIPWKRDLACKERKCGGTSASRDENGQVDVWR